MAKIIKVNTKRLKNDADSVNACIESIKNSMENLKTLSSQLDSMWDGEASEAFKSGFVNDIKNLDTAISNLIR